MTNSDLKMGHVSFVLSIVACLLAGAALIVGLSARARASGSVAEALGEIPTLDAEFELGDGERIEFLGLKLRLIRVERADAEVGWDDSAVLALESEGYEQRVALPLPGAIEFGPFHIRAARAGPLRSVGVPPGRGKVRLWIRHRASLAARNGGGGSAGGAEVTKRLSRGDQFEFNGLRLRLVRVEENDPTHRDDDSVELSLVTAIQSSQLVLREFDTLFFENYEITAERVSPSPAPADAPGRGRRGEGTADITVRLIGQPEKPPPRRPIG